MGNAPSVETDAAQLKEELAEMHRSLQALSVRCSPPPVLLRDQFLVDNVIVDTRKDVQVLLGPVVGKIEFQRARVLLEVDRHARVTAFVSTFDAVTNTMVELPQLRCAVQCQANQPTAFVIERLVPGKRYSVTFGGIKSEDVAAKRCNFRTQTLEHGNKLSIVVVSGDNVYDLESGERNLWKDVRKRVEQEEAPTVLHLGGQVAMKRMFDQAVQLLVLYANGFSGDRADRMDWPTMEAKATEILRSAYRSQWTLSPDLQFVLANACNLMMWSDGDIYPQFSTRDEFFIDHEQPTLRMQVIRTVTRCARRLFHEYQRQLWDNNMKQLIEYEMQLCEVSEKALASMGQIFTITHKIPNVTDELAILKKRHDIDGARRVDKHLRALEAEKAKMEKQMISFNQLLAPQRGEEFLFEVGRIAVLVLDLRSSRLEPGGSQARENDLLSNLQWRFVEETLERSDIQLLVVCSEVPIIGDIQDGGSPTTAAAGVTETRWDANSTSQSRLLSQLFDWKLQQPNRQFVVLAGANEVRCYARMSIKDTKLRVNAEQYTVGAISAKAHAKMIPRRNGLLYDRFEFEHCEDISNVRCFLELKLESSQGAQSNVIEVCRGGQDKDGDNLAKKLTETPKYLA
ncbi:hypothetical protein PHYBOEH_012070 [Phytophthora boehmeriae]|uniref:Uncharacterized protein n=1 Tax=Phytophthora boehmeriae TaxID=109152 RepID=A0A8T1X1Q7_9STRA|nr:hypothetical protein PHYBOEH_012070 [Phytophthora boehmeriae]